VLAVESWTAGEPFFVLNSDNYYPVPALAALAALDEPALVASAGRGCWRKADRSAHRRFAVLDLHGDYLGGSSRSRIRHARLARHRPLREHELLAVRRPYLRRVPHRAAVAAREMELPLAVQHAMSAGQMRVRAIRTDEAVLDLSSRADIASVASRLAGVEVRL
jgi:glucose-1-phosphate thymidylyltransferase